MLGTQPLVANPGSYDLPPGPPPLLMDERNSELDLLFWSLSMMSSIDSTDLLADQVVEQILALARNRQLMLNG